MRSGRDRRLRSACGSLPLAPSSSQAMASQAMADQSAARQMHNVAMILNLVQLSMAVASIPTGLIVKLGALSVPLVLHDWKLNQVSVSSVLRLTQSVWQCSKGETSSAIRHALPQRHPSSSVLRSSVGGVGWLPQWAPFFLAQVPSLPQPPPSVQRSFSLSPNKLPRKPSPPPVLLATNSYPPSPTSSSSFDPRCVSRVANLTSSTTFQTQQPPAPAPQPSGFRVKAIPAKVFSVNFFACAEGAKYERFLPMYAFFALQSNRNSAAELVVPNSTLFLNLHERALTVVKQLHGRRSVWVREYRVPRHRGVPINTRRFLEVPEIAAEYVYLGDIDILITESVLSAGRLQQMRHSAPYSNILRKGTSRLTGVILVRAREFYTRELKLAQVALLAGGDAKGNDEAFLARLVTAASFALPPANETYRPLHGLHLSNSRGPNSIGQGKAMGMNDADSQWCPVLGTPGFQEYISIDDHARTTLQSFATYTIYLHPSAQEQERAIRSKSPQKPQSRA